MTPKGGVWRPPRVIRLVPVALESSDRDLLFWLGAALTRSTGMPTLECPGVPVPSGWRGAPDAALSSSALIDVLIRGLPRAPRSEPVAWTLALTSRDLCAPGRPFVYGEATVGGYWAVVSTFRLGAQEARDDEAFLRRRVLTEGLHELGHLAGIGHCPTDTCVMKESATPEEIDRKGSAFCEACKTLFDNALVPGRGGL